uniref:Uncharacterized protein n=1 Tax=viral metagenome TaxID=1070528 RepID=A0A6M3IGI8_9ZZZZ
MNIISLIIILIEAGFKITLFSTGLPFNPEYQIRTSVYQDLSPKVEYNFEYSTEEFKPTFKEKK